MKFGVATVGKSSDPLLKASVSFGSSFSSTPVVVVTPLQGTNYKPSSIPDTFAVTVTEATTSGFQVNIYRVDSENGWDQDLRLGWYAEAD